MMFTSPNDALLAYFRERASEMVLVDTTHKITLNGLLMTTIMVRSPDETGIPIAFCISTSYSGSYMNKFLEFVCQKTPVKTKVFMTDMAPQFYKAWVTVNGNADQQRYYYWHVEKAWNSNLGKLQCDEVTKKHGNMHASEQISSAFGTKLIHALYKLCPK